MLNFMGMSLTELCRQVSVESSAGKLNVCNSPVRFLVGFTGCGVRESLVAVPTAERLLSSVNTHVSLEITSVGEFLPTVLERRKHAVKGEPTEHFKAECV